VTLSDGSIRNTYDVRLRNMNLEDRPFRLSLTSDALLRIELEGQEGLAVTVPANEMVLQRVYVIAPAGSAAANAHRTDFRFWVEDLQSTDRAWKDTSFSGKGE
jgi:hypothetical protein